MDSNTIDVEGVTTPSFSKTRIATHFGLKVHRYGQYAVIQRQLIGKLLPLIMDSAQPGDRWIDIGCGNGALEDALQHRNWPGSMTGMDIAFDSLRYCTTKERSSGSWLCADAERPPLQPQRLRGMVITSTLQWSSQPAVTITKLIPLLESGGMFVFSFFTKGAFQELFDTRSRFHLPPSVSLLQEETVEPMLRRAGLEPLSLLPFSATEYFPSAGALLRNLSSIGSTGLPSQPLTRSRLKKFCDTLEDNFRTENGVPLTYKALYGIARKGDE